MSYTRLIVMAMISFAIMYAVMFFNVDQPAHIYLSINRLYMTLLMVCPMQIVMVVMMKAMYPDRKKNRAIMIVNAVVFSVALFGLRKQVPIGDKQYMKAMIPHHSSAIMTSRHADIKDPEVKALSEKIIRSQRAEIEQMKNILDRLE